MEGASTALQLDYSTLVSPIVEAITSGVTELLPIGISLMAISIGISLIPRIIYKFF